MPNAFDTVAGSLGGSLSATGGVGVHSPSSTSATPVWGNNSNSLMSLIAQHLMQPQAKIGGPNMLDLIKAVQKDPTGRSNASSSMPSYRGTPDNPFNAGYFKSGADRAANETAMLGHPGSLTATPAQRLTAEQQTARDIQQGQMQPAVPQFPGTSTPAPGPTFNTHPTSGLPMIQPDPGHGAPLVHDGTGWKQMDQNTGQPLPGSPSPGFNFGAGGGVVPDFGSGVGAKSAAPSTFVPSQGAVST